MDISSAWIDALGRLGFNATEGVTQKLFKEKEGHDSQVYTFEEQSDSVGLLKSFLGGKIWRVTRRKAEGEDGPLVSKEAVEEEEEESLENARITQAKTALSKLPFKMSKNKPGESGEYEFTGDNDPNLGLVKGATYRFEIYDLDDPDAPIYLINADGKDCCLLNFNASETGSLVPLDEEQKEGKGGVDELRSQEELTQTVGGQLDKAKKLGTWATVRHHARKVTGCAMAVFLTPVIAVFTSGLWVTDRVIHWIPTGVTILHNTMNSTAEGTQVFDARGLPGATCGTDPTSGTQYCAYDETRFSWSVLATTVVLVVLFAKALREAGKSRAERTLDAMTSKGFSILQTQLKIGRFRRCVMSLPLIGPCFESQLYANARVDINASRTIAGRHLKTEGEAKAQLRLKKWIEEELNKASAKTTPPPADEDWVDPPNS